MKSENIQSLQKPEEKEIDIKKIIYLLLRQWHWFALFGVLGLILAFGYTKFTKTYYSTYTSILIPPEKTNGIDMQSLFQGSMGNTQNNTFNQIEIIKSFSNIKQTLINLNWRTSWYEKDLFAWKGIYKHEPFDVQEAQSLVDAIFSVKKIF